MHQVGVVIGRFQVENLHEGHRYLINEAFKQNTRVIVFVGCAPIEGTKHDPLDYHTRERMLRAAYPDAIIMPLHDKLSDEAWSKQLDSSIRSVFPAVKEAVLYGGRDSFKSHYVGEFTAVEVDSGIEYQSGTNQREAIGKVTRSSADFRAGVIYSTQNSWPYTKMCVDIACIRYAKKTITVSNTPPLDYQKQDIEVDELEILLGRKESEDKWRLPGGGVDRGETLEQAAAREFREETKLMGDEISKFEYIYSGPVGDWRYKNAGEIGLMTALFLTKYNWGAPMGGDDLVEVKWVPLSQAEKMVVKAHKPLINAVKESVK